MLKLYIFPNLLHSLGAFLNLKTYFEISNRSSSKTFFNLRKHNIFEYCETCQNLKKKEVTKQTNKKSHNLRYT